MAKLTDGMLATLQRGAARDDGLISPAPKTTNHVADQMAAKLVSAGVVEMVETSADQPAYGPGEHGGWFGYRVTPSGFDSLGIDPSERPAYAAPAVEPTADPGDTGGGLFGEFVETVAIASDVPVRMFANDTPELQAATASIAADIQAGFAASILRADAKPTLGAAADAVLVAWGLVMVADTGITASRVVMMMTPSMTKLAAVRQPKAAKTQRAPRAEGEVSMPKAGRKGAMVVDLVSRPQGCTIADVCEATGWNSTSARGFLSSLHVKHGMPVTSAKGTDGVRVYTMGAAA